MEIDEIDARIKTSKEQIRKIQDELESIVPRLITATTEHVVDWSKKAAKKAASVGLTADPSRQDELGAKIPSLRADVDEVLERIPSLVEKEVGRDYYWAHRAANIDSSSEHPQSLSQLNGFWSYAGSKLYGLIGQPLVKHGFVDPKGQNAEWVRDNAINETSLCYVGKKMAGQWEPPPEISALLTEYRTKWDKIQSIRGELHKLGIERAKIITRNAWGE